MTQDYQNRYNTYPIHSEEFGFEGALKRFSPMPTPKDVFDSSLFGLPKIMPLTQEPIMVDMVAPYLESAIADIEMELGMNISPVQHTHSEDYVSGMFENNFMGIKLQQWPATKITLMRLKYPHTNTTVPYQMYTIPANWIYLRKNRVNVVAAVGSVNVSINNQGLVAAGGIFSFIAGFGRGAYQPGSLEVVYTAGFEEDKLPSNLADLIKTWASIRFLSDILPALFPTSGTSVSIDGVSQSAQYNIPQALLQRIEALEKKKKEIVTSLKKAFGRNIKKAFLGS